MEESLRLQNQQYTDEGSSLSNLRQVELILHNLTTRTRESEAFSNFESESDNEHSVQSNYRSSHDTPENPVEDGSEHTPTPSDHAQTKINS